MLPLHLLGAPLSAAILVSRSPEASDCPDAGRVAAQVERIVGRPLAAPAGGASALVVRVDFSRAGGTYEAAVRLTGAREGERMMRDEGATCDGLADAVAVSTALLLDPTERAGPTPPPARRATPAASWFALAIEGRAGANAGFVPGATWMTGVGVAASLGPLTSVTLGATLTGARTAELGEGGVAVRLWFVELGAFRSLTGRAFRAGPFVELLGGAVRGQAEGYPSTTSESLAWFAVGAGIRAEADVGPLRLGLRAFAAIPTRKQSFSIKYVGTAHDSAPIGGAAEVVVGVPF